jgi:hypothetical protein
MVMQLEKHMQIDDDILDGIILHITFQVSTPNY